MLSSLSIIYDKWIWKTEKKTLEGARQLVAFELQMLDGKDTGIPSELHIGQKNRSHGVT